MRELRIALRNVGNIDPLCIKDYQKGGGYHALQKAKETAQEALINEVERSGRLRGRGGAGFNTGLKWRTAFTAQDAQKYVVCNADEGEPGTYKDRIIMENDPHTLLEGMTICAYAVGATQAIIYCRAEYPEAIRILKHAITQATEQGLLAPVTFTVRTGAGAYVCGEETALLESLEGNRGEPRLKPPYPTVKGLYGKPTVVNNVETFAAIPMIVEKGAKWYSAIGSVRYTGTKIFTLSGDVLNKSYFEVPSNTTLRELIYDFGGGICGGRKLKAVQVGGNSGAFLTPEHLDTAIELEAMAEIGAALGSGALFVLDETRDLVDVIAQTTRFFRNESCGKCVSCREGTRRMSELMDKIRDGHGEEQDLQTIQKLGSYMRVASFCPLGQSVPIPVFSGLKYFLPEFEKKISQKEEAIACQR